MSLKKEIMAAVKSEQEKSVRLNAIAYIYTYKCDALDKDVDKMFLMFEYIGGIKGGHTYEIFARDYDDILKEIDERTQEYMKDCADEMAKKLRNGLR